MRILVIAITLVLAGCAAPAPTIPPLVTTDPATPVPSLGATPVPSLDVAYLTARAAAQGNAQGIVSAWRLFDAGAIDETMFRQGLGILLDAHLDWYEQYGGLTFDHPDLAAYGDAMSSVLDALAADRDATREIDRLAAAAEQLAP